MTRATHSTAAPAALLAQTENGNQPPRLYRLLANYWDKYDLFVDAMQAADAMKSGSPEEERALAAQNEACDLLDDAGIAILEFRPTWSIEAGIKHNFVEGMEARNGRLTENEVSALIAVIPFLIDNEARKGGAA